MGRSRTSKYALEMDGTTSRCWWIGRQEGGIPGDGKPTEKNLIRYVKAYIDSMKLGGSNAHISKAIGHIPVPNWARIVVNDGSRRVVASWTAPMFMAI